MTTYGGSRAADPLFGWHERNNDLGSLLDRLHRAKVAGRGDWCCSSSWCSGPGEQGVVIWVRRSDEKRARPKYGQTLEEALRWAVEELWG
ncbi:MAG: hypothetical protein NUW21_13940 [Elusimicrobia bacterium]|nr:hypothetical protein [Elusimicrobiota bacterium]